MSSSTLLCVYDALRHAQGHAARSESVFSQQVQEVCDAVARLQLAGLHQPHRGVEQRALLVAPAGIPTLPWFVLSRLQSRQLPLGDPPAQAVAPVPAPRFRGGVPLNTTSFIFALSMLLLLRLLGGGNWRGRESRAPPPATRSVPTSDSNHAKVARPSER